MKPCYPTCHECANETSGGCLSCVPNAGIMGLPNSLGQCPCQPGTIEIYSEGCTTSMALKLGRDVAITSFAGSFALLGGVAALSGSLVILEQAVYLTQIGQAYQLLGNQFSMGIPAILKHFNLYSLQVLVQNSSQFF
jgi:hypothetical protein